MRLLIIFSALLVNIIHAQHPIEKALRTLEHTLNKLEGSVIAVNDLAKFTTLAPDAQQLLNTLDPRLRTIFINSGEDIENAVDQKSILQTLINKGYDKVFYDYLVSQREKTEVLKFDDKKIAIDQITANIFDEVHDKLYKFIAPHPYWSKLANLLIELLHVYKNQFNVIQQFEHNAMNSALSNYRSARKDIISKYSLNDTFEYLKEESIITPMEMLYKIANALAIRFNEKFATDSGNANFINDFFDMTLHSSNPIKYNVYSAKQNNYFADEEIDKFSDIKPIFSGKDQWCLQHLKPVLQDILAFKKEATSKNAAITKDPTWETTWDKLVSELLNEIPAQ